MKYEVWTSFGETAVRIAEFRKEEEAIDCYIVKNTLNLNASIIAKSCRGQYWVQVVWLDDRKHIHHETIRHSHNPTLNKAYSCQ